MVESATKGPEKQTNVTQFAVTNVAELLERLAYYGFTSIFALSLEEKGYSGGQIGIVAALLLALPYVVPLLSGAIAEKIGYRPMMLAGLAVYVAGFATLATWQSFPGVVAGAALVATGAGGFKPITAATISHVTSEKHRNLGFTVYYTGINVGGFFGPILVALVANDYDSAAYVSGASMVATFLLIFVAFRNPQPARRDTSIAQALGKLADIRHDRRFLLLLVTFAGFWFLYSMNFSFVASYLDHFVERPAWFEASLQQSFNPLVVMILGVPIGALATKYDARRMMTIGVGLYLVGFSILGFVPRVEAFFVGLFIATVGEILAYPAFLAYVAKIAPPDRVAVYQSYGFLPIFLGFFFGPLLTGPFFERIALQEGHPSLFWAIPLSVGVLALAGFLATWRPGAEPKERRSALGKAAIALLLIPIVVGLGQLRGATADIAPEETGTAVPDTFDLVLPTVYGGTQEGNPTRYDFQVPGNGTFTGNYRLFVDLVWNDLDSQAGVAGRNDPEVWTVQILAQNGTLLGEGSGTNDVGEQGHVTFETMFHARPANLTAVVTLVDGGDDYAVLPLLPPQKVAEDTEGGWELHLAVTTTPSTAS